MINVEAVYLLYVPSHFGCSINSDYMIKHGPNLLFLLTKAVKVSCEKRKVSPMQYSVMKYIRYFFFFSEMPVNIIVMNPHIHV